MPQQSSAQLGAELVVVERQLEPDRGKRIRARAARRALPRRWLWARSGPRPAAAPVQRGRRCSAQRRACARRARAPPGRCPAPSRSGRRLEPEGARSLADALRDRARQARVEPASDRNALRIATSILRGSTRRRGPSGGCSSGSPPAGGASWRAVRRRMTSALRRRVALLDQAASTSDERSGDGDPRGVPSKPPPSDDGGAVRATISRAAACRPHRSPRARRAAPLRSPATSHRTQLRRGRRSSAGRGSLEQPSATSLSDGTAIRRDGRAAARLTSRSCEDLGEVDDHFSLLELLVRDDGQGRRPSDTRSRGPRRSSVPCGCPSARRARAVGSRAPPRSGSRPTPSRRRSAM